MKETVLILLLTFFTLNICATDIDNYFGRYSLKNQNTQIQFELSTVGILNLQVDNLRIEVAGIMYDYLGVEGSSQILKITFKDDEGGFNTIKVFVVVDNGNFLLASGYYLRTQLTDPTEYPIVVKIESVELDFEKEEV